MGEYKSQIFGRISPFARLHRAYVLLVPIIGVGLLVFGQLVAFLLAGFAGLSQNDPHSNSPEALIYILVVSFGLTSLAVFAWVKFVENRSLASIGWRFERAWFRYGRGFVIGLLLNVLAIALIAALGGYDFGSWFAALANPSAIILIAAFLVGFIIQGGTEEILVRGWMMSSMASRWGIALAVGVTSSLFALLHLPNEWPHINWIAITNIVLVGVFFAVYALKERSLLGVCGAHASWNWIMSVGFGLNVSGMRIDVAPLMVELKQKPEIANWITGGSFGPEGSLVVTMVLGLATLLLWRWRGENLIRDNLEGTNS